MFLFEKWFFEMFKYSRHLDLDAITENKLWAPFAYNLVSVKLSFISLHSLSPK